MAVIQIYRYQILTNNPSTDFVAGDIVDVFVDTDSTVVPAFAFQHDGISVNLNGVDYPSSGATDMLSLWKNVDYVLEEFNPQICNSTYLLQFQQWAIWPFAFYSSEAGHPSCAINSPTCDLMVVGIPDVIPSSAEGVDDGSISVTATSSNPIEYKLGSTFLYGDGSGQSDGNFSALLPGTYTIYLRDSLNCFAYVQVEVPVDNTFGTKFVLEYDDNNGNQTRLNIKKRGYDGASTEIIGADAAFRLSLRGEGSINKFTPLLATMATLGLTSITDRQFLEIYTNDPNLYRIEYLKNIGGGSSSPMSIDALSSWLTSSADGAKPDWTTGAAPSVTLPGAGFGSISTSEFLYSDFVFVAGNNYSITLTFTRVTNFGSSNPRTARLSVTDSSFNIVFTEVKTAAEGSNDITMTFTATADCERIAFSYASGMNVTITVNAVSGTQGGYQLKHVSKILPNQSAEEYKAPPYYVSFVASDGLKELSEAYLIQDNGQKYFGTIKEIKLVAHCLRTTRLDLPIRVACNLYAVDMDQTDSDDPLDQAYCDFEAFYLAEKEPTLDFVLRAILEKYGAQIIQWEGRWNITRVEEKIASYDFRDFDKDGNYISNGSFNPVVDIDYPTNDSDLMLANTNHFLELRPGYGYIKMFYHLGLKPNILNNGDFRLNVTLLPDIQTYSATVNTEGWTLSNAGYSLNETWESISQNNIAYKITSGADSADSVNAGKAYLQSESYTVRMGSNNQLKFRFRYKVDRVSVTFGGLVYQFDAEYVKVRVRVKYGDLYLQANGAWTAKENIISFPVTEFDKYTESELIAKQPVAVPWSAGTYFHGQYVSYSSTYWACLQNGVTSTPSEGADWTEIDLDPVSGQAMDVRMFIAHPHYTDFQDIADLEALPTYYTTGSVELIPTGYTTELRDDFTFPSYIYYYKLEETTDAASGYDIVEPDDYHVTNNPRKWVLQRRALVQTISGSDIYPFYIDRIQCSFLTDGKDPIDTIVRSQPAESGNKEIHEVELYLGSYSTLVVSEVTFGIDLGAFFPKPGLTFGSTNILSAELIYAGWLRDSNGVGFENWARDGVSEEDKLHAILLKSYTTQYRRSWKLFRGDFLATSYFGFLNVARLVDDSNTIYMPIGLELDDKRCIYSGELLELISATGGSDGGGSSPYSSGFSTGFGASGFN